MIIPKRFLKKSFFHFLVYLQIKLSYYSDKWPEVKAIPKINGGNFTNSSVTHFLPLERDYLNGVILFLII